MNEHKAYVVFWKQNGYWRVYDAYHDIVPASKTLKQLWLEGEQAKIEVKGG